MKYPINKRLHRILFQGPLHIFSSVAILVTGTEAVEQLSGKNFYFVFPFDILLVVIALIGGGFLADYIMSAFEDTSTLVNEVIDDESMDAECE